jgi:DNA gyrase subunit A
MADKKPEDQPELIPPAETKAVSLQSTEITEEMKSAYLDYAMTVIVARALPDVRDGLKPVHRRVLYAMHKMGLNSGARFSKSAKVVGEVLGKYHPHGDAPVYEAIVRMAQDFSMRYPLVKGQGNFGSIDGDPAAAMRYTEVKLAKIAEEMLVDIEKETVGFIDNFDGSLQEPLYLPAKLPNLLLMGAEGIAVGMATKIPPHNLNEIADAAISMIDKAKLVDPATVDPTEGTTVTPKEDPVVDEAAPYSKVFEVYKQKDLLNFDVTTEDLMQYVKGPDFPTAGIIYGANDIKQIYATGRGKIMVRALVEEEEFKGRTAIVVKQLPYQVNKANLVEKIAHLVTDKKIVGISDLRDESDREGIRVVIELKRDASYKKVLNNLFKFTELQTSFPVNVVALVDGVPQTLSLPSILEHWLKHRVDIVTKRSEYELRQAKARAHILEGYLIALDHIDEVIKVIRGSKDEPTAKAQLMSKFGLSEIQAQAILEMQLRRLTGLERSKIEDELKMLRELINYLEDLLKDVFKILKVVKDELLYLKEKYGDERKTKVVKAKPGEISDEELIENKDVFVVLTKEGYIKQIPTETFKVQNRGGKGVSGMETKETDNVYIMTKAQMHDYILYFSNQGRVFQTRIWDIPQGSRISKGKAIVNLLTLRPDEKITSILTYNVDSFKNGEAVDPAAKGFVVMITKNGTVKKTPFQEYANIRSNGLIAIKLEEGDELLWVRLTKGTQNVMLISREGKAIMFKEEEVRTTGRSSIGVKGIELEGSDVVVSADVFDPADIKKDIFVISDKGIGKKTPLKDFKGQHRGGKGVKIASIDTKFGKIAFVEIIDAGENTVIISSGHGQVVKIPMSAIPSRSRTAKGVILMRFTDKSDKVVSATFVE